MATVACNFKNNVRRPERTQHFGVSNDTGWSARYFSVATVRTSESVTEKVSSLLSSGVDHAIPDIMKCGSLPAQWSPVTKKSFFTVSIAHKPMPIRTCLKNKNPVLAIVKVSEYAFDGSNSPEGVAVILGQRTIAPKIVQVARTPAKNLFATLHTILGFCGGGLGCRCFSRSLSFLDLDIYVSILRLLRQESLH